MTAPALPGAAPDPARLPPEVDAALGRVLHAQAVLGYAQADATSPHDLASRDAQVAVLELRTAIARALGGDGEPVAGQRGCKPVGNRASVEVVHSSDLKPDDVIWSEAWCVVGEAPKSEDGAFEAAEIIDDAGGIDRPQEFFEGYYLRVTPSHTRPAATGDTGEGGARG